MIRYASICPNCKYRVKLNSDKKTFSSHYKDPKQKIKCEFSGQQKPTR